MAFPNQCQVYGSVSNNFKKTRRDVVHILGTHKPVVITKSPGKPNLAYPVHEKSEMEEVFDGLIEECELNSYKWKKGHHFCWTYDSCSELFSLFHRKLSLTLLVIPTLQDLDLLISSQPATLLH